MKFNLLAFMLSAAIVPSSAQDAHSLVNQIAESLSYPISNLIIFDESASYAKKTNDQAIRVFTIKSNDQTFAPLSIAITERGVLLKPEIELDLRNSINEGLRTFKGFELDRGVYGYQGLGMAGPGGSEERILATWPERGVDFQIKVIVSRDGVEFSESTKAYHAIMVNGGPILSDKLVTCIKHVFNYIEDANIRGIVTAAKTSTSVPSLIEHANSQVISLETQLSNPSKIPPSSPRQKQPTKQNVNPVWWIVCLIILVAGVVLVARKKNPKS